MAMNRLPRELIDRICSCLQREDLKNVLTLTDKFRYAAERYSEAFAEYIINDANSHEFVALYSGRRLPYLRNVIFKPSFTKIDYDWDACEPCCRQSPEQLQEWNDSFTHQVKALFDTLKAVEDQAEKGAVYGRYRLSLYSPTREVDEEFIGDCLHHHYVSWRIRLLKPAELPELVSVRSLEIHNHNTPGCADVDWQAELKLDLRVTIDLAMRFSRLEYLVVQTGGHEWYSSSFDLDPATWYERDWEGPRRDTRHQFADVITSTGFRLAKSLKRATLDFMNPLLRATDIHHDQPLPNLVHPAHRDPFSSSLSIMANNLRELRLRGVLDENLFPANSDCNPFGPNLEVLEIMFHIARPDGTWYFKGEDGKGSGAIGFEVTDACYPPFITSAADEEMDDIYWEGIRFDTASCVKFRVIPNDSKLRPLLEGFARAAAQMHLLKEALIWTSLSWNQGEGLCGYDRCEGMDWGIGYSEPDACCSTNTYGASQARSLWWSVQQWRPDVELHKTFRQIGRTEHGETLHEHWAEEAGDNGSLVYRDFDFHSFMPFSDPE